MSKTRLIPDFIGDFRHPQKMIVQNDFAGLTFAYQSAILSLLVVD